MRIKDPWFRCQALSHAAYACPDPVRADQLLDAAVASALDCEDANRIVVVAAWPVKVMTVTGRHRAAFEAVERLVDVAATLDSPVRRAHALDALAGAAASGPSGTLDRVLEPLFDACRTPLPGGKRNRDGIRRLVDWIPFVEATRPGTYPELDQCVVGPVYRSILERLRELPVEERVDPHRLGPNIAPSRG